MSELSENLHNVVEQFKKLIKAMDFLEDPAFEPDEEFEEYANAELEHLLRHCQNFDPYSKLLQVLTDAKGYYMYLDSASRDPVFKEDIFLGNGIVSAAKADLLKVRLNEALIALSGIQQEPYGQDDQTIKYYEKMKQKEEIFLKTVIEEIAVALTGEKIQFMGRVVTD